MLDSTRIRSYFNNISDLRLTCLTSAILILLYNFSAWDYMFSIYGYGFAGWWFMAAVGILLWAGLVGILLLFSWPYILKPFLIFILLISALSAYCMDNFGYIFGSISLQNIFETDYREAYDLISGKLFCYIGLLFCVPSGLIAVSRVRYSVISRRFRLLVLCLGIICLNVVLFNKHYVMFLRNHKFVRYYINPVRPLYAFSKYVLFGGGKRGGDNELVVLDGAPKRTKHLGKPRLVILVVGESDRAANHSLNGYARQTNPLLSLRKDVYSFSNVYSCGTETTISVPCMFGPYNRDDFSVDKAHGTENVLDLLHKSGVEILWRDNDSGCKNVCDRIAVEDFNDADIKPYCNNFECHDEVLLYNLQAKINSTIGDQLIVLHKKGNHGPAYYRRYPERFNEFLPICASNEITHCSDEELLNTYDNVVLYTDYFLDRVIKILEQNSNKYQTGMIYVSDHGESLGENGVYLHAMPYLLAPKHQKHIPFMIWFSKDFAINRKQLQISLDQELSHDHLFHTLLGLFKIKTIAYNQELDILK